ncbi:MAG: TolC family protein [Chthoniobacteraceae bacterium]
MKTSLFFLFCLSTCVLAAGEQKEPAPVVLDIAKAESIALRYAPKIGAAYFKAEASKQQIVEARADLFPQITGIVSLAGANTSNSTDITRISASGGLNNPSVYNRESNGVTITQLITDFGRTSNLISATRYQSLSEQEKTRLARAEVILLVDATYFKILGAQALLQVANETVSARQLVMDQVSELTKAKLKSDLDLSFAKVDLANARLLVLQAQNAVGNAESELSAALGYRDRHHFLLTEESQYIPGKTDIEPLIFQALQYRPELVALRDEYQGAMKFSSAQREARYPVISAIGATGRTAWGDKAVEGNYSAGAINVELPIFTGGRLTARYREAEFNAKALGKTLQDAEDEVVKDVNEAWLNALTDFDKIQVTKDLVANAQQALELAQSRYKLGLNSIIELSQAQLNATQAEIGYASAKYEYQVDRVKLEFDTGALKYRTPISQFH